ncbi:MAG: TetR/AcrR family transcriptional regulator [Solirubrobacteraceae bacterium]|nr:TetR/AcrR family transcriptional regulator [Solirubrobacteraceae bacterium]
MPLVRTTSQAAEARERGSVAFLDAAESWVGEGVSYSDVGIADLAARAGFSRARFYAYFDDKRALAVAVADRFAVELGEEVDDWLAGADAGPVRERLERVGGVFARRRGALLLVAEAATYDPDIRARWKALHRRFEVRITDWVARADPSAGPAAAAARAFVLTWSTQASLVEHLADRRDVDPVILDALAVLWEGTVGGTPGSG